MVVIWGCGFVGQMVICSVIFFGVNQVIVIDCLFEWLSMVEVGGVIIINFEIESVVECLNEFIDGKGFEKCIDCVGMELYVMVLFFDILFDCVKQMVMVENDWFYVLCEMIYVCWFGGIIFVFGVYSGLFDMFFMGVFMNKGLMMCIG